LHICGAFYGKRPVLSEKKLDDVVKVKISLKRHSGEACGGLDPVAGIQ
jgi:hypothetical protein